MDLYAEQENIEQYFIKFKEAFNCCTCFAIKIKLLILLE